LIYVLFLFDFDDNSCYLKGHSNQLKSGTNRQNGKKYKLSTKIQQYGNKVISHKNDWNNG